MDIEIKDNQAIIESNTNGISAAFFRVFEAGQMIYYASSRLGTVDITPEGFVVYISEEYSGKNFELKTYPGLQKLAEGKMYITHPNYDVQDHDKEALMENNTL